MVPYVILSPAIDHHPQTIPTTTPESPSLSTITSFNTIDTTSPDLSSPIIGKRLSAQPPVESTDASTLQTAKPGPFTLHKHFFFGDGNITFLVDDILYRVHRYFFCRDSNEFMTRLSRLPEASPPIISLENVKSKDFDAFLSVLYPLDFDGLEEWSSEELTSILDLSTRWGFNSIRNMAIRCLKPSTPHQKLLLGRKYAIEQWILSALQELCERPLPLTLGEARLMDFEDVVLIGSVRETIRSQKLTVASEGIKDSIEAWRNSG